MLLFNHAKEFLVLLGKAPEPLPSVHVKKIVVPGIDGTGDRIVSSNDGEGFGSYLPIFPFNGDIELGSFVVGICGKQRAFMFGDALELPEFGARIIQLFNVV